LTGGIIMSIEKNNNTIDRIRQSAADAQQAEQAAMQDCEQLNAQIEIVRSNATEEITNSVETTVKAIDKSLQDSVEDNVERPADEVRDIASETSQETSEDLNKDREALSALDGINTQTIDVSSEVGESKGKIEETMETREEQIENLDTIAQEAMELLNNASKIELD